MPSKRIEQAQLAMLVGMKTCKLIFALQHRTAGTTPPNACKHEDGVQALAELRVGISLVLIDVGWKYGQDKICWRLKG